MLCIYKIKIELIFLEISLIWIVANENIFMLKLKEEGCKSCPSFFLTANKTFKPSVHLQKNR